MKLKNEKQKQLLLQIIQSAPMQGDYTSIVPVILEVEDILRRVESAELEDQVQNDQVQDDTVEIQKDNQIQE